MSPRDRHINATGSSTRACREVPVRLCQRPGAAVGRAYRPCASFSPRTGALDGRRDRRGARNSHQRTGLLPIQPRNQRRPVVAGSDVLSDPSSKRPTRAGASSRHSRRPSATRWPRPPTAGGVVPESGESSHGHGAVALGVNRQRCRPRPRPPLRMPRAPRSRRRRPGNARKASRLARGAPGG